MGGVFSRTREPRPPRDMTPPSGYLDDPRSPTEEIHRTPIVVEKKQYLETNLDDLTPAPPLRIRLLRKNFDPRSPTAGIDRSPISMFNMTDNLTSFGSPVSIYSNNQSDVGSVSYLPSPAEPSVNVSDFENDNFLKELDNLVNDLNLTESDLDSPGAITAPKLQLNSLPTSGTSQDKLMAKKLCEDLIYEMLDSLKNEVVKQKSPEVVKRKLSLQTNPSLRVSKGKVSRKPLGNITSSAGNTPNRLHIRKNDRVIVEPVGENSPARNTPIKWQSRKLNKVEVAGDMSPVTQMNPVKSQWDHESTVII